MKFLLALLACGSLSAAHFEGLVNVSLRVEDPSYQVTVTQLKFDGKDVPLEPHNLFKPRAEMQYKLPPGRYHLVWSVQKGQGKWIEGGAPKEHEKVLVLVNGDIAVRVLVKGDTVNLY